MGSVAQALAPAFDETMNPDSFIAKRRFALGGTKFCDAFETLSYPPAPAGGNLLMFFKIATMRGQA